jgi:hypothetical protein
MKRKIKRTSLKTRFSAGKALRREAREEAALFASQGEDIKTCCRKTKLFMACLTPFLALLSAVHPLSGFVVLLPFSAASFVLLSHSQLSTICPGGTAENLQKKLACVPSLAMALGLGLGLFLFRPLGLWFLHNGLSLKGVV